MKISVLGCGRWGSFHAWYAASLGHDVALWGRESSLNMATLKKTRKNEYLTLQDAILLTTDLKLAIERADICVISISAQQLRSFVVDIKKLGASPKPLILCMKGLEADSGKRLTEVVDEELGEKWPTVVWVGPGHVQDFIKGIPNCMVMASNNNELTQRIVDVFNGRLIRFYYGEDLLGVEIGAAAKNVVGLAAGMLDGLGCASLKGALMSRGTRELSRLIAKMGGDAKTVYGLSHLGDYEATLFSQHSNNRRYGENYIKNIPMTKLAEGVNTSKALVALAKQYEVELPICETVCNIVCHGADPKSALDSLFLRSIKTE